MLGKQWNAEKRRQEIVALLRSTRWNVSEEAFAVGQPVDRHFTPYALDAIGKLAASRGIEHMDRRDLATAFGEVAGDEQHRKRRR